MLYENGNKKLKYNPLTELFETVCIHDRLNVYELSDYGLDYKRIVIERVYDGGGIIPHSELFCCGEVENVFHWQPIKSELGYYVLDRKAAIIRLGATPAGPVLVKMHFIPTKPLFKDSMSDKFIFPDLTSE